MAAVLQALWAAAVLALGVARTLVGLAGAAVGARPMRIDLPIPGFPIDVVLVSKPEQIQARPLDLAKFAHQQALL